MFERYGQLENLRKPEKLSSSTKGTKEDFSRKGAKHALSKVEGGRKEKTHCHFDRREKSFSDPSHSLGMTGLARHFANLASLRLCSGHAWRE
jgi:hypothetical protein